MLLELQIALTQLSADLEVYRAAIEPQQVIERPLTIEELIRREAVLHSVDPNMAVEVARCESGLNPKAQGDGGQSRGLWQIHKPSHPYMTDEKAFDPKTATAWAMPRLKETPHIWTCWRKLFG